MSKLLGAVVTAALCLLGTGVASAATQPSYHWSQRPSPIVLEPTRYNVYLQPSDFCWEAPGPVSDIPTPPLCSAGIVLGNKDLRAVRTQRGLHFWFGRPGWTFITHARRIIRNGQLQPQRTQRVTARRFRINRPRHPGDYRVTIVGSGPEGQVSAVFRWRVLPHS